jgi:FkbM family methyltransferase
MSLLNTVKFIVRHPLNRTRRARAVLRFAKWQIESRLRPGGVVVEWINGSRLRIRSGDTGVTGNIYTGLYEFEDMAFLLHLLRSTDVFVDVGANCGAYTVLACSAVGARGYAFEPAPAAYERLIDNVSINRLENRVICVKKCVGAGTGVATFSTGGDALNHVLAPGEAAEEVTHAEMCSLDRVLDDASPLLMKIDVEGFETAVLEGAAGTLRKPCLRAAIIEVNGSGSRYGYDESRVLDAMQDLGFRIFTYDPARRELREGRSRTSSNVLFVRDVAFVQDRLKGAPAARLRGRALV